MLMLILMLKVFPQPCNSTRFGLWLSASSTVFGRFALVSEVDEIELIPVKWRDSNYGRSFDHIGETYVWLLPWSWSGIVGDVCLSGWATELRRHCCNNMDTSCKACVHFSTSQYAARKHGIHHTCVCNIYVRTIYIYALCTNVHYKLYCVWPCLKVGYVNIVEHVLCKNANLQGYMPRGDTHCALDHSGWMVHNQIQTNNAAQLHLMRQSM